MLLGGSWRAELRHRISSAPHRGTAVLGDHAETGLRHQVWQAPAKVGREQAVVFYDRHHLGRRPVPIGSSWMGRGGGERGIVAVLDDQPASAAERRSQTRQADGRGWEVHEERPAVDKVVGPRFDRIGADVVAADFDSGPKVAEEAGVDVGGDDEPVRSDGLGQPASHRAAPGPDLEAAPTRADADGAEPLEGDGVVALLEQVEAAPLGSEFGGGGEVGEFSGPRASGRRHGRQRRPGARGGLP